MTSKNGCEKIGICEVLSAPRSPWQRAYVERVIGSIRRECLDHVIVFHDPSLRRTLNSYFDYYHRSRTHLSLGKDSPERRRKWGPSWQCHRSVDCTTVTSDGLPEEPDSTPPRTFSPWAIWLSCLTYAPLQSRASANFPSTRLKQGRRLLDLRSPAGGMISAMGCTEFSVGTIAKSGRSGSDLFSYND
jgi:hypothetical protein